jgi:hypothetical protein
LLRRTDDRLLLPLESARRHPHRLHDLLARQQRFLLHSHPAHNGPQWPAQQGKTRRVKL